MSVTYTAVLDVSEDSVLFLSGLLHAERMTLPHPRTHYPLELIAPAPDWAG